MIRFSLSLALRETVSHFEGGTKSASPDAPIYDIIGREMMDCCSPFGFIAIVGCGFSVFSISHRLNDDRRNRWHHDKWLSLVERYRGTAGHVVVLAVGYVAECWNAVLEFFGEFLFGSRFFSLLCRQFCFLGFLQALLRAGVSERLLLADDTKRPLVSVLLGLVPIRVSLLCFHPVLLLIPVKLVKWGERETPAEPACPNGGTHLGAG